MSLFSSLMGDVEDDPFFGSHMRQMRQMNNMMNSMFADPFGMFGGGGPLAIGGPQHASSLMPFMPPMPNMNRMFSDLDGHMGTGSSYSSSTVVMSSGLNGNPQVYSSTSSTKIGPNGIKETRKTLEDSRTGTKKMSIGHHIGDRSHVIEREQNLYSGDQEERQEFINLDEEEADDFNREFQNQTGSFNGAGRPRPAALLPAPAPAPAPARLALLAPPSAPAPTPTPTPTPAVAVAVASVSTPSQPNRVRHGSSRHATSPHASSSRMRHGSSRYTSSPNSSSSANVRSVYSGSHPQRHRHKRASRHAHEQ